MIDKKEILTVIKELQEIKNSFNTIDKPRFTSTINKTVEYLNLILLNGVLPSRILSDEELVSLHAQFGEFKEPNELANLLFNSPYFRRSEIRIQMDYDKKETAKLMDWLTKNKFIESTSGGFRKKVGALPFLRYVLLNPFDEIDEIDRTF